MLRGSSGGGRALGRVRRAAARFEQAQHGREVAAEAHAAPHALEEHFNVLRAQGHADSESQPSATRLDRRLGVEIFLADAAHVYVQLELFVGRRADTLR